MDFMEIASDQILVMRGAALGMGLDHNEEVYYILSVLTTDHLSEEKVVTMAIPPMATQQFLRVVNEMDPKREQSL